MNKKRLLTSLIILVILAAFVGLDWETNSFYTSGFDTVKDIGRGALSPDWSHFSKALEAAVITLSYAGAGLVLAMAIGFTLSLFGAGLISQNKWLRGGCMRLLAFMRAIHELIWALFFVASIGLSPLAAVFAIAIPYGGMLGKVYTDIFLQVKEEKVQALRQVGASKAQLILFAYLPEAYNNLVSYTLYRFECAIRSSSILSFVGLAGLGLRIQLNLNDLQYSTAFMYVYVLVALVALVDLWGNLHRRYKTKDKWSGKLMAALLIFSWYYVGHVDGGFYESLFTEKNLKFSMKFIHGLLGVGVDNPAFLDQASIVEVLKLTLDTLQMSLIAITLAGLGMLTSVIFATRQYAPKPIFYIIRGLYLFTRAIPELIWAMIIVFVIKPGILAGAVALAIHNFGILSKLCAEVVEDLDQRPLQAMRLSGAGFLQMIVFGVLPMASSQFIKYTIYRWEIILRTTIIVGFIGAGGLGYYFKTHMSWFHYTHVSLVLIAYFILVRLADWTAHKLDKAYSKA